MHIKHKSKHFRVQWFIIASLLCILILTTLLVVVPHRPPPGQLVETASPQTDLNPTVDSALWAAEMPKLSKNPLPSKAIAQSLTTGLAINNFVGRSSSQLDQAFGDIASLGFGQVRLDIIWSGVQPQATQQYTWKTYDPIVTAAARHNLKVLGVLDYAPAWAAQAGCTNRNSCEPANPSEFAAYAGQAAAHYKQKVQYWEIWNEENTSQYWSPVPNALQYAQILKQAYSAIKNMNPESEVLVGGMARGDGLNGSQIDALQFLQQLYADGAGGFFDAVGYHPYTSPSPLIAGNPVWAKLVALHAIMQANGDGDKQIWITEYGAPTGGPAGSNFVSEAAQAQLAQQAYAAARTQPWIGPFFWYTYQDRSTDPSTKENFFGLKRADGTPKPAYYAWQQLLAK